MKKIIFIIICCNLLLVGCWDERLYKELTIVPLMGFEGEPGKVTGHFMYLGVTDGSATYSTVEASGVSVRDSRATANMKTNETLDVTQLEVILLSDGIAKSHLIDMFDAVYRMPNTKLGSRFVLVEGDIAPYMKKPPEIAVELPDYYVDMLDTAIAFSIIPDVDIQQTARYLNDDAIDAWITFY